MNHENIFQICTALGTVPGVMLDEEIINLPIHAGAARRDVAAVVGDVEALEATKGKAPFVQQALVYATALRVLPYYKQQVLKIEQSTAAKVERFAPDWEALEASLRAGLDEALSELVPDYEPGSGFIGFRLTFKGRPG